MSPWRLRTARNQDAEGVERFLLSIREFAGSVVPEEERRVWCWLFVRDKEAPDTAVVAENGTGDIVAHYGIARLVYRVDGKDVPAGMICKLAIAEPYRREPLFLKLTLELLKAYPNRGLGFLQGLANRTGLVGYHRAFGFQPIGDVPVYVKPVRFSSIARRVLPQGLSRPLIPVVAILERVAGGLRRIARAARPTGPFRIEEVGRLPADIDDAWSCLESRYRIFARRSAECLQWRFFDAPGRNYRVFLVREDGHTVGYFVLREMAMKGLRALAIVDICFAFERTDLASAILAAVDAKAIEARVDVVAILCGGKQLSRHLRRFLYFKSPERFTLVVHEQKNQLGVGASSLEDWFVTWFDHDYV
jgi:hypothetical protein